MSYTDFLPGGTDAAYALESLTEGQTSQNQASGGTGSYGQPAVSAAPPPPPPSFTIQDLTTGSTSDAYGNSIARITPDNLAISAEVANAFIVSGTGNDIVRAQGGGTNVLDDTGGAVNFEIGSTAGGNAFFLDASNTSVSWNTIANLHAGDFAVIYGIRPQDLVATAHDNLGAPGYTGLTLETFQNGGAAFLTLAGHSAAELGSSIATAFGTDPSGRPYLLVVAH